MDSGLIVQPGCTRPESCTSSRLGSPCRRPPAGFEPGFGLDRPRLDKQNAALPAEASLLPRVKRGGVVAAKHLTRRRSNFMFKRLLIPFVLVFAFACLLLPGQAFAQPALSITKSHTGNFTVGTNGTYTITVSNSGTN